MKPFCRRTCGRCDCDFEESFAFGFVDASNDRVRTITSPLEEVLVDEESGECPKSIFDVLTNASQFTLLVEIVKSVGLDSTLRDSNVSISLFAPVNEVQQPQVSALGVFCWFRLFRIWHWILV